VEEFFGGGPAGAAPALRPVALATEAFAVAGRTPAAVAAREELGGKAGAASAPWVTNVGGGPWPGRLVLRRLAAATEGGEPWLLRG